MYKLVCIDLDGTLLNSYGQVSNKNKESIKKLINKNVEVVIASGRPINSASSIAREIESDKYVICGNGSVLYDLQKKAIIYDKCIEKKKVLQIIKECEENSIYYNVYTENLTITKSLNYNTLVYNYENQNKTEDQKTNIKIVDDIYSYIENSENINVLKITICDDNEIIFGGIIRKLRQIKGIDVLDVAHMSRKRIKRGTEEIAIEYYYTEITSQNVNKWNAIKELSNILGIKDEEIVAIGDNINDKEMIEKAGLGIVMGNSAPYMKEFADVVVNDNNNDGVSDAIENYILKE